MFDLTLNKATHFIQAITIDLLSYTKISHIKLD